MRWEDVDVYILFFAFGLLLRFIFEYLRARFKSK